MDLRIVFVLTALGIVQCKLLNSCGNIKSFVKGHNMRRLKLARGEVPSYPAASKMTYLIWDEELAAKASAWASKKKYGHNPDRTIPSGRFTTGENIYWYGTSNKDYKFDPNKAMDVWWNEYKDTDYHPLSVEDFNGGKEIGHFTQMAWAKTTRIGCAISQYIEDNLMNFYVVCNYGPAGNIMGQTMYEAEKGASNRLVCGESNCSRKYGRC